MCVGVCPGLTPTLRDIYGWELGSLQYMARFSLNVSIWPSDWHSNFCCFWRVLLGAKRRASVTFCRALGKAQRAAAAARTIQVWSVCYQGDLPRTVAPDVVDATEFELCTGFCMSVEGPAEPSCPPSLHGHTQLTGPAGTHRILSSLHQGLLPPGPQVRKMLSFKHATLFRDDQFISHLLLIKDMYIFSTRLLIVSR